MPPTIPAKPRRPFRGDCRRQRRLRRNGKEEREDRESALDDALSNIGMDDQMPDAASPSPYASADTADYEEMVYGEQTSFYDSLKSQMVDVDLDDTGRQVMEYIIGSLDGDGLLRKSADSISDELAVYHNIDYSEKDVAKLIKTAIRN